MAGSVMVKEKIDLTKKEEKIVKHLLYVVKHFELEIRLHVTGGWVHDKVLGKDYNDIDFVLDNMLGREFCDKVNEYLHVGEKRHGVTVIRWEATGLEGDVRKQEDTARVLGTTVKHFRKLDILVNGATSTLQIVADIKIEREVPST
ncbi:CCA tRNA nucleotidyltransferase, mitochondrial-like [Asparagus officinalis]|uniref:CCA tRNA nucleotidyltransferase, mitochondrial-like n=1 Tax=Asparagus officinalis TaxID=4686 RepID=UPI00098E6C57|nr:CCA tRNA nucleotidyltransferase, mitochondrial-like [Asparagus officinalis]